jgi:hypothetical protein
VIKVDKFRFSYRPYAVDLSTWTAVSRGADYQDRSVWWVGLTAVWFRGPKTAPKACIGRLHAYLTGEAPADAVEALQRMDDGRYGGDCQGRWNGVGYWGAESPDLAAEHMAILRPMLDNFPEIPPGYDGWWTYP